MRTALRIAILAILGIAAWAALAGDDMAKAGTQAGAEVRVVTEDAGRSLSFEVASDGKVSLKVDEKEEGKKKEVACQADSWSEFRQKYPAEVKEYRLDRYMAGQPSELEEAARPATAVEWASGSAHAVSAGTESR